MLWAAILLTVVSGVIVFGIIGYINNLALILSKADLISTNELIIRIIGIFVVFVGAVMGWM